MKSRISNLIFGVWASSVCCACSLLLLNNGDVILSAATFITAVWCLGTALSHDR